MTNLDPRFREYAIRHGLFLFPLRPGSKEPIEGLKWQQVSSGEPAQWDAWDQQYPDANWAVDLARSGLFGVGPDADKVGRDVAWAKYYRLSTEWGFPTVPMPQVQSARHGMHAYFKKSPGCPELSQRKAADCVDVRASGYFVVPASKFEGGTYFCFDEMPPPHEATPQQIAALKKGDRPDNQAGPSAGDIPRYRTEDVIALARFLNEHAVFEDYDEWCEFGMASKHDMGEAGQAIWAEIHDETVTASVKASKWRSFKEPDNPVTLRTFLKKAHELGWTGHLQKTAQSMFHAALASTYSQPAFEYAGPVPGPAPADDEDWGGEPEKLILSSAEFVGSFTPPDYLVDGILQRGFCYSITGQTGTGKTAVVLLIAALVATGQSLGTVEVTRGTVLYFAGENPTDIKMRWLALTKEIGVDPHAIDVHFVDGATPLSQISERIQAEAPGQLALVIVDTSAAYFEGDDENSNKQAIDHARRMRALTGLPGNPCVVICCHPTKRASDDDLIPRGGGAFLAEVDGNIAVRKHESLVVANALGKFRGPEFAAIHFELHTVTHPLLKDSRGRDIRTVVAQPVNEAGKRQHEMTTALDEDALLQAVGRVPGTPTDLARMLCWTLRGGEPNHVKVKRSLERLAKEKLVEERRHKWRLTSKGQIELNRMDMEKATSPPFPPPRGA